MSGCRNYVDLACGDITLATKFFTDAYEEVEEKEFIDSVLDGIEDMAEGAIERAIGDEEKGEEKSE